MNTIAWKPVYWTLVALTCTAIFMASCKNDAEESAETTEDRPVLERVRTNEKISFEARDQSGNPVPLITVFETLNETGGAVYRFEHGQAMVAFEPGGSYVIQAENFEDFRFTLPEIDGVRRMTFFLNHKGNTSNTPVILGHVKRRNFRPYAFAGVTTFNDQQVTVDNAGAFKIDIPSENIEGLWPVAIAWTDDENAAKTFSIHTQQPKDTFRFEVYFETDTPKEPKD